MRLLLFAILTVIAITDVFAAGEEKEFVRLKYEWVVSEGEPCMVVFEPQNNAARIRKTYYFNKEGEMKALLREELDSPTSTRPVVMRFLFAFDSTYHVIGVKQTSYNYGDGGNITENEVVYNITPVLKVSRYIIGMAG